MSFIATRVPLHSCATEFRKRFCVQSDDFNEIDKRAEASPGLLGHGMMQTLFYALLLVRTVHCFVHPIAIHGRYFHDTVTREPFFLKGVDYQPGGSSAVTEDADPLSNPDTCARDIILFQELNINVSDTAIH